MNPLRLELNFHEHKLKIIGIDHIVFNARLAEVSNTRHQIRADISILRFRHQLTGGLRDNDVVILMDVPTGLPHRGQTAIA